MASLGTRSDPSLGPCGRFRFHVVPHIKVGLVHLERKRAWPSAVNPATGNQWSDDMKKKIVEVLGQTDFEVFRVDQEVKVDEDKTLRIALSKLLYDVSGSYQHRRFSRAPDNS